MREENRGKVELVTDAPKSRLGTVEKSIGDDQSGDVKVAVKVAASKGAKR